MLERNKRVKPRPEKFQKCRDPFDVIITCEERIYDLVLEDIQNRDQIHNETTHIINIDIEDNPNDATLGAFMICDLCTLVRFQLLLLFNTFQLSCFCDRFATALISTTKLKALYNVSKFNQSVQFFIQ